MNEANESPLPLRERARVRVRRAQARLSQAPRPYESEADMPNRRWSRDEDVLVLDLYFKHGRRKLPKNHQDVVVLSGLIDRTSDAVSMRMSNVVACDPDDPKKGFANVAKQTKSVWDEFAHDEPRLRRTASAIRRKYGVDGE